MLNNLNFLLAKSFIFTYTHGSARKNNAYFSLKLFYYCTFWCIFIPRMSCFSTSTDKIILFCFNVHCWMFYESVKLFLLWAFCFFEFMNQIFSPHNLFGVFFGCCCRRCSCCCCYFLARTIFWKKNWISREKLNPESWKKSSHTLYVLPFHSNGFSSAKFLFPSLIEFGNDFLSFLIFQNTVAIKGNSHFMEQVW